MSLLLCTSASAQVPYYIGDCVREQIAVRHLCICASLVRHLCSPFVQRAKKRGQDKRGLRTGFRPRVSRCAHPGCSRLTLHSLCEVHR
jgi:hypothetical protein